MKVKIMQLDDVNYSRGIRSDIIDGLSNILQPPTLVRKFKSLIRTCLWHLVKFVEVYDMIILLYPQLLSAAWRSAVSISLVKERCIHT